MKHSSSYEDFRRERLKQGGSATSGQSPVPSFGIRKAKSDPDVGMQNMQKDLEVVCDYVCACLCVCRCVLLFLQSLTVDNKRLRESEKKLLKENLGLGRKCRLLTKERDRAEDRLKIEQTQRDSIERLRQRNKELEDQVQKLRQRQLIKEREKALAESASE